ncbi:recombinase family protein [Deinococcus arenicola]|uniref:Recombinase zinc beta ribbon domain-containing protein n=1 Tax=Deinococcus arenicola TaxID=2994950 RepID=A0ABU4DRW5_9DEIO|nr:recombinase family protein [Deinococcus sp. ZS9-10]MDV6375173.1 recombinase zinc beta ribbon domain-containing protein [Deinococcus sp. ZS9-10]
MRLIQEGVPVARPDKSSKGLWTVRHVLYILRNEAYTGRRTVTGPLGETAVVTFPALVSGTEFRQVQQLVASRRHHQGGRTRHPALFAGHTRCTACGGSLTAFSNANTSKAGTRTEYHYYRCRNTYSGAAHRVTRGGEVCTHNRLHRMEATDEAGWTMFCEALTEPDFLAWAAERDQPPAPDHGVRIGEIRGQMAQAVRRVVTHHLPDEVLAAALAPLQQEPAQLEKDQRASPAVNMPDMTALAAQLAQHLPTLVTLEQRQEALTIWMTRLHIGRERPERVQVTVMRY